MNSAFCRARLVVCALLAVVVYIATHEAGHALAAVATGRTVEDITILSLTPHIGLRGHSTPAENAFAAAAGSGLVVALWFIYLALRRSRRVTWVSEGAFFFTCIELLAWFASSALHTVAPPHNDVTKFIVFSGVSPAVVAIAVACLAALTAKLYFNLPGVPASGNLPHAVRQN